MLFYAYLKRKLIQIMKLDADVQNTIVVADRILQLKRSNTVSTRTVIMQFLVKVFMK